MRSHESRAKLQELILYISRMEEGDDTFGAIKLSKLLFYADFLAYLRFGKSITNDEYQRLPLGPAPRHLVPAREELVKANRLAVYQVRYYNQIQERTVALDNANLDVFSASEIALVDEVIKRLRNSNATEVSNLSHLFVGWICAKDGETIPYSVALVARLEPTRAQLERARELEDYAEELLGA